MRRLSGLRRSSEAERRAQGILEQDFGALTCLHFWPVAGLGDVFRFMLTDISIGVAASTLLEGHCWAVMTEAILVPVFCSWPVDILERYSIIQHV